MSDKSKDSKKWQVKGSSIETISDQQRLVEALLELRGVADVPRFLSPTYAADITDTADFADLEGAARFLHEKVKDNASIVIFGDYDADGITSTAILTLALQQLGANVTPHLPSRDDGYGLNLETLKHVAGDADVLITVDCGITARDEVAWLKENSVGVVIVDHHEIPDEVPAADYIVHPARPENKVKDSKLCGAGMAWKLATALLPGEEEKWLLDLAALGTIADMVPLVGENRAIVKFGLEILKRTQRPGLKLLLDALDIDEVNSIKVAHKIVPALNAAGRIAHPQPAFNLLMVKERHEAEDLVAELVAINRRRQTITRKVVDQAAAQVNGDGVIFAHDKTWAPGIVGLVAGRLADKFGKPAVVVGGNEQYAVGSARAPAGFNILEILQAQKEYFLKLGGHKQAAGFSLDFEQVPQLSAELKKETPASQEAEEQLPIADLVVSGDLASRATHEALSQLSPFGFGNEDPLLVFQNLEISDWYPVGKDQTHAKITFKNSFGSVEAIAFGLAEEVAVVARAEKVCVLGKVSEDSWRGRKRLQLEVTDIADAATVKIHESNPTH